jgi:peptidoglycan hydrolase-like protein with peptidoglycan-binding domain
MEKVKKRQRLLSFLQGADGRFYYEGPIDGIDGPGTQAGAQRFLEDYGFQVQAALEAPQAPAADVLTVMVFSLAADGDKFVSPHFRVREFACNDGSDVVLIHPILLVWAEALRTINGAFKPNSAYRTVSYNASIPDASPKSKHCQGIAMDVPAVNATPEELYDLALTLVGDSGGLGIYPWGIHIDCRPIKSRWDYRKAA